MITRRRTIESDWKIFLFNKKSKVKSIHVYAQSDESSYIHVALVMQKNVDDENSREYNQKKWFNLKKKTILYTIIYIRYQRYEPLVSYFHIYNTDLSWHLQYQRKYELLVH